MAARKKAAAKSAKPAKSTKVAPLSTETAEVKAANEVAATELAKVRGETDSQKSVKAYHEGKFQTHDPVTGEKRDKPLPE